MSQTMLASVDEAAELLGISNTTLRFIVKQGQIPVVRIGRRVLISRKVLDEVASGERSIDGPVDTRSAERRH